MRSKIKFHQEKLFLEKLISKLEKRRIPAIHFWEQSFEKFRTVEFNEQLLVDIERVKDKIFILDEEYYLSYHLHFNKNDESPH